MTVTAPVFTKFTIIKQIILNFPYFHLASTVTERHKDDSLSCH